MYHHERHMIAEYLFTEAHATVLGRYVRYNYEKIVNQYQNKPDVEDDEYFTFTHENARCKVVPICDDAEQLRRIQVDVYFLRRKIRDTRYYFCTNFTIWRKRGGIDFEHVENMFKQCVGKRVRVCMCESIICNDGMDRCENCYVYSVNQDDPCCICLENDYSWVQLNCNCKGGRRIHLHCFHRLQREYDDGWKTKCPCCRKKVGYWDSGDVTYNPNFVINNSSS